MAVTLLNLQVLVSVNLHPMFCQLERTASGVFVSPGIHTLTALAPSGTLNILVKT